MLRRKIENRATPAKGKRPHRSRIPQPLNLIGGRFAYFPPGFSANPMARVPVQGGKDGRVRHLSRTDLDSDRSGTWGVDE
jgi:hypothetical protein